MTGQLLAVVLLIVFTVGWIAGVVSLDLIRRRERRRALELAEAWRRLFS